MNTSLFRKPGSLLKTKDLSENGSRGLGGRRNSDISQADMQDNY